MKTVQNNIIIAGIVIDRYYSHTFRDTDYYIIYISVPRNEDCDIFKVLLSENAADFNPISLRNGDVIKVNGHINSKEDSCLFIYGQHVERITDSEYYLIRNGEKNLVFIEGVICSKLYVHSFMGTRISSGVLACNRTKSDKTDYIPISATENLSKLMTEKHLGDKVKIYGRLQTRIAFCNQAEKRLFEVVVLNIKDLPRIAKEAV